MAVINDTDTICVFRLYIVHCLSSYLVQVKAVLLYNSQNQYHIAAHPAALGLLADTSLSTGISCENSFFFPIALSN